MMPSLWSTYEYQPSFILGFHGCEKSVGDAIIQGTEQHLRWSDKEHDWLGHGVYFWEGDPARAWQWALQREAESKIAEPCVIGAIIDLKHCLDLFSHDGLLQVKEVHSELEKTMRKAGAAMPRNVGKTPDKAGRRLDCAVMNYLHEYRRQRREEPYDSVRGAFLEGEPLYKDAGFRSLNHIQICVRSPSCIKGYFRPLQV